MSSYWAGYHGMAMVLNQKEFDSFIKKYEEATNEEMDEALNDMLVREYPFRKSAFQCENFEIIEVLRDDCEGACLHTLFKETEKERYAINEEWFDYNGLDVYAIFSDYSLDGPDAFLSTPYPSFKYLVQEFKDKMEKYLPEDFDWCSHIGRFSYAAYA